MEKTIAVTMAVLFFAAAVQCEERANCTYNGTEIEDFGYASFKKPCMVAECYNGKVYETRCPPIERPRGSCWHKGFGTFPTCCRWFWIC